MLAHRTASQISANAHAHVWDYRASLRAATRAYDIECHAVIREHAGSIEDQATSLYSALKSFKTTQNDLLNVYFPRPDIRVVVTNL